MQVWFLFTKIAKALSVACRYVGEEPTSVVTGIYNQIMAEELPKEGIACRIIPRKENEGTAINASAVHRLLQKDKVDVEALKRLVPQTTLDYFLSGEGVKVREKIRGAGDVVYY